MHFVIFFYKFLRYALHACFFLSLLIKLSITAAAAWQLQSNKHIGMHFIQAYIHICNNMHIHKQTCTHTHTNIHKYICKRLAGENMSNKAKRSKNGNAAHETAAKAAPTMTPTPTPRQRQRRRPTLCQEEANQKPKGKTAIALN